MPPETIKQLNQIGLICQFLSFFLATPEILGQQGISAFRRIITSGIKLVLFIITIVIPLSAVVALILFVVTSIQQIPFLGDYMRQVAQETLEWGRTGSYRLSLIFLIFFVPIIIALVPVFRFYGNLSEFISDRAEMVVDRLEKDDFARRLMLLLGAAIFTVGTLFQLAATL